ncbi:MAG: hypothetical protein KBD78_03295 [Oligoflexales bacterium]|nr:hypothetical protein [Oligoflexales bacterium]
MKAFHVIVFLSLTNAAISSANPVLNVQILEYRGEARSLEGDLVYHENHRVEFVGEQIKNTETFYFDKDRKKIASLVSDYSYSQKMPTYEFTDYINPRKEGLRRQGQDYEIYFSLGSQPEQTNRIKAAENVFASQGWHYYLVNNLSRINETGMQLQLVLPSELDAFEFKLKKTAEEKNIINFSLTVSSWFLRLFAPELKLSYDKKQKRLLEYEGVSNVLDRDGKRQKVKITYFY